MHSHHYNFSSVVSLKSVIKCESVRKCYKCESFAICFESSYHFTVQQTFFILFMLSS